MTENTLGDIPVTIISGFLGSGKTTLLNHLLNGEHGLRVAVMVNDFGEINIDTQLVVDVQDDTVNLANGCICCSIRDNMIEAVLKLLQRPDAPEYIVIEASGVSDPRGVMLPFFSYKLMPLVHVDSVITMVDAEQIRDLEGQNEVLARIQLRGADIVVLNKADLITPAQMDKLNEWVREMVPRARILETTYGQIPLELVLGSGRYNPNRILQGELETLDVHVHPTEEMVDSHPHHDHTLIFSTWSYNTSKPFSRKAVQEVVKNLPADIFRVKGILYLDEWPEQRAILHMVGRRNYLTRGKRWGDQTPHSQIVAIGTQNGVNAVELTRQFEACLLENLP